MVLEDYFDFTDFEKHDEIRIQGHRIWMHDVLQAYLRHGHATPQQLQERFPSLTMDKILACLLYYHTHEADMNRMLADWEEYGRQMREKFERENADWLADLRRRMEAVREARKVVA